MVFVFPVLPFFHTNITNVTGLKTLSRGNLQDNFSEDGLGSACF